MPRIPGPPLTKITLNLFTEDVETFKEYWPFNYTEHIRDLLHQHAEAIRKEREVTDND